MSQPKQPRFGGASFLAYFLGAVIPLAALGVVVERFVLPTLDDRIAALGLLGAFVSIVVLSLASFLVLGRNTNQWLRRMDEDNRRLAALFETSGRLAEAPDVHAAAATTALGAHALVDRAFVYVMMPGEDSNKPIQVAASAGDDPLGYLRRNEADLMEMAGMVLSQGRPAVRGGDDRIGPAVAVPVRIEGRAVAALMAAASPGEPEFGTEQVDAFTTMARLAGVALHSVDLRDAQRNFFAHVTDLLVHALDSHLGYNTGHSERVARYANRLGRALELDEHRLHRLHFGALLHDIGMLKFDRQVRKNSMACRKHAALGARMVGRIRLWKEMAPIVQCHHEWFDGSGYPDGISGDAIPLEARIVAVCDAFDAMTSESSYKPAISAEAALRELERGAGTQFDPRVVEVFLDLATHGAIEVESSAA